MLLLQVPADFGHRSHTVPGLARILNFCLFRLVAHRTIRHEVHAVWIHFHQGWNHGQVSCNIVVSLQHSFAGRWLLSGHFGAASLATVAL